MSLRLVFMGTPDFSIPALRALKEKGHTLLAVYSQPPKPAGRGQKIVETPVHKAALEMGLEVRTPSTLRDEAEQAYLKSLSADAIIVAAYGLLLPKAVLTLPRFGCLNIHASLLPRWRGAAPIQRAILAGDKDSGVTIMQMFEGLDTGDMLLKESLPITNETTTSSLHDGLSVLGARMIVDALDQMVQGTLRAEPQSEGDVTYASKLEKAEGFVDWTQGAEAISRKIRALTPWPGVFFQCGDETIKILKASVVPSKPDKAGLLLDDAFTVSCGGDALRLEIVQRQGKKPTQASAVLRGLRLDVGHSF